MTLIHLPSGHILNPLTSIGAWLRFSVPQSILRSNMVTIDRGSITPPYFDGPDYTYWKICMRAPIKSTRATTWENTKNVSYLVPKTLCKSRWER